MMEDTSRAQASKEQSFLYKQVNIPLTSKNKKKMEDATHLCSQNRKDILLPVFCVLGRLLLRAHMPLVENNNHLLSANCATNDLPRKKNNLFCFHGKF